MHLILPLCATMLLAAVDLDTRINEGRDALRRNEYAAAESILSEAAQAAKDAGDDSRLARALFFLGLMKQEQSQLATPDAAIALRVESRRYYEQSLQLYPSSGAALSNLGDIYVALGELEKAREVLEKALALDIERHRARFSEQLGNVLSGLGKHKDAAKAYRRAIAAGEPTPDLRQKLVQESLAAGEEAEDLIPHLWALTKTDRVDAALSATFNALLSSKVDGDAVDPLFGVVAAGLAVQNYSPSQLSQIGVLTTLRELQKREPYRRRVDAIIALYEMEIADRDPFMEWPERVVDDDVPPDLSPRRALVALASALGRRAYHGRDYPRARGYFELADELGPPDDARLLTDLAVVAFEDKRLPELESTVEAFEKRLYEGESLLARADLENVYELHRALGTMYASLGRWTNAARPSASAMHQLQRAVLAADLLSERRAAEQLPPFEVDGNVKQLLAAGYRQSGRVAESTAYRIEAAETYASGGDLASARDVIASIPPTSVGEGDERSRYAKVVDPLVTFIGPVRDELPDPAAVKGCIIVLWRTSDNAVREDARKKLEQIGVRVTGRMIGTVHYGGKSVQFAVRTTG